LQGRAVAGHGPPRRLSTGNDPGRPGSAGSGAILRGPGAVPPVSGTAPHRPGRRPQRPRLRPDRVGSWPHRNSAALSFLRSRL